MIKLFWKVSGFFMLGLAYIGLITPGIPFSIFLVCSAYCFSKGSERMHKWIYEHKHFGPFLTNWQTKRIFPLKMKYMMVIVMSSTLVFTWLTTYNLNAVIYSGIFMALVALWAWRFPSSEADYDNRIKNNKKIGWLK